MADDLSNAPWAAPDNLPDAPWATEKSSVPPAFLDRVHAGLLADKDESLDPTHESISNPGPVFTANSPDRATQRRMRPETVGEFVTRELFKGAVHGLATLPKRLTEASEERRQGGDYDPGPAMEAALLTMGTGTRFARTTLEMREQVIGTLPKDEDFANAARVLGSDAAEPNLRALWEERGIHPAEAAHDAQSDAFLKQELTTGEKPFEKNGVPLSPTKIAPPTNSPMPAGTPRSELAKTGEPHVDSIIDHPTIKRVIDNPVIDDTHDIPNSWGGSLPLENPTTYIDREFPKRLTVDGVTFDPAEPAVIHENVEAYVIDKLVKDDPQRAVEDIAREHGITINTLHPSIFKTRISGEPGGPGVMKIRGPHYSDGSVNIPDMPDAEFKKTYGADKQTVVAHEVAHGLLDKWDMTGSIQGPAYKDLRAELAAVSKEFRPAAWEQAPKHASKSTELMTDGLAIWMTNAEARARMPLFKQMLGSRLDKIGGGMAPDAALRVAYWGWGNPAEHAWYRAHGMDPAHVEDALRPILDGIAERKGGNIPDDLFRGTYPDGNPQKASAGDVPKPTAAEVAQAREIMDRARAEPAEPPPPPPGPPRDLPSYSEQPPPPPGRLVADARKGLDQLFGLGRNIQYLLDPMATGSSRAMVIAKDAISTVRRIRWEWLRADTDLVKRFSPEQWERMWNALDEESVLLQEGKASERAGLATLTAEERAAIERLQSNSQAAWLHATDAGLVEGEGLPAYNPRMVMNVAAGAEHLSPQALNELGRNVFTRTAQMKHRSYLTAEETEAAAKRLVEKRMTERGASAEEIAAAVEKVAIARNIRALPMATARLEEAAVWKEMINRIEDIGKAGGDATVADFNPGKGWFTIAGNPAFTKWKPELSKNPVTGKWEARTDDAGNVLFTPQPIYIRDEFRGPLTSILDEGASKSKVVQSAQSLYGALMALKGKSMTVILNSPLIHNEVVWSKVAEAAGGREMLGFGLYFRGNRIVNGNAARAGELIERGLNPMGPRGAVQDITAMMEEPNLQPGRSLTARVTGFIPGLFDAKAGIAVERAIDKAGNFVHNTLLWDRVRDVQFGLADHLSDRLVAKGTDRLTADRISAHFSNIIVGSIPKEAMSAGARATANMLLFSRSFTLGNLSTFKQAALGLPKPILAQIERDFGMSAEAALPEAAQADVAQTAKSIARRKAMSTIMLSAGLYYVGNAFIQHAMNIATTDATVGDEMQGYARRYKDAMEAVGKDPFELRHIIGRLSPTYDNEPQKQDRALIGYDKDGTAVYARNPTGKFGEEMIGYPTMPMTMVKRKLSPMAGGILDILENDKGFGRKIYDENDSTIGGDVKTAFAVAKYLVMKHLPEGQITSAIDLLRGDGDPTVNKLRLFGPMAGFTASVGAPGGQARGEQLAAKGQFDARFNVAWPDIRKQVQRGDIEGATAALDGLGVPPRMQFGLIRNALNPSGALRGRTLRDFFQTATPEQIERFNRANERAQPAQ